jgi:hypothetical protein
MKITIESTDMMVEVQGVPCRMWRGVTEGGVGCDVAVRILRVRTDSDRAEFERELKEMPEPRLGAVSFRSVW